MTRQKLLILTAREHEIPFILAARNIGFYVITTNNRPDYFGHKYADEYIYGDYSKYDDIVEIMQKNHIDAISQACSDDCALTASYVGEKLGLKGHDTYENACIIHRKDKFKEFAKKYNIKTPISNIYSKEQINQCLDAQLEYPVIIKPNDLAGGIGVSVAHNKEEYIESIKKAFDKTHSGNIVVEPYIEGTLHSLNTFIVNQKVVAYCTANDYSYKNKYMTNTGVAPADNWEKAVKELIPETEKVARILNLVDGQLHMQYIMSNGKSWIIEMMRRNIGNNWMTMLIDSIGVNWPEWVIRAEAGLDCSAIPQQRRTQGYYGYHMLMCPNNGTFKRIEIAPEFKKFIYQFVQWQEYGSIINNYLTEKVANLMFHFNNEDEKNYYLPRINEFVKVICK